MTIKVTLIETDPWIISAVEDCPHLFEHVEVSEEIDYAPTSSNPDVELASTLHTAICRCGENVSQDYEWGRYFMGLHDDTVTKIKDWLKV